MDQLIEMIKNFGLARLVILASVILGVGGGLHFLTSRIAQPEMALLYSNLDMADAGKIVSRVESLNIPVDLRGGGTEVYVPTGHVARLRMELAEMGLPRGGSIGYEIFDKTDALGTSGFVQDVNLLRALEGEIARTISSISQVESARVHLVLPKRELFSREHQDPSASILLKLYGTSKLPSHRVQSIQHLVASAVPGLNPDRVSIVDDRGNLLASGEGQNAMKTASNLDEVKVGYETRLSSMIESLLEYHVGKGKVRAEVTLDMDFDRVTENSEEFNPDGQVIRSTQVVEEGENASEAAAQATTAANTVPQGQGAGQEGGKSSSNRREETTNYEISKKMITHIKESGVIKRLSVAVLVAGKEAPGKPGETPKFEARPKEELDQLTKLIQNAVGYNKDRGDSVEIVNMPFVNEKPEGTSAEEASLLGLTRPDIVRLIEGSIIGFVSLLILFMVVKPLLLKVLEGLRPVVPVTMTPIPANTSKGTKDESDVMTDMKGNPALAGPDINAAIEKMIDIHRVEGQVRESSLKTITNIIESKPDETVAMIRQWMHEK